MAELDCAEAGLLITALVDGELPVEDVARLREHLERCGDCAARHRMEERVKAFLKERAEDVRTPPELGREVRAALARVDESALPAAGPPASGPARAAPAEDTLARRARERWRPLAALAALLVGITVMWVYTEVRRVGVSVPEFMETLANIHYAATEAGIFQVRTQDRAELSAWLADHLGRPVTVPDLEVLGLVPAGGRVVTIQGVALPMALYRDYDGNMPDMTVIAAGPDLNWSPTHWRAAGLGDLTVHQARIRGQDMALVEDGGAVWIMISTCGEEEMRHVAGTVAVAVRTP
jgi:anti-sigma factor (TIGR02949 family)